MRPPEEIVSALRRICPEPVEIVGGAVEGLSSARFLLACGYERVTIRDKNPHLSVPDGCDARLGEDYLKDIPDRATVLRSAGIRSDLHEFSEAKLRGGRILSQLHIFLGLFQGVHGGKVCGITGTFGKGTITTLLAGMLKQAGIPHVVGGNIGVAMLDLLLQPNPPSWAVLELSSFQLHDLGPLPELPKEVFIPRLGVCGRVTIEHLDWHKDQIEYWEAKARLCEEHLDTDQAVYLCDDPGSVFVGMAGSSLLYPVGSEGILRPEVDHLADASGGRVLERSDMKVPGAFQLANAALAWAAARCMGATDESCHKGAIEFRGLVHRLQWVAQKGKIDYYNDSYATRPEATLAAVEALSPAPLALILGGSDKGIEFDELAQGLRASPHLRHVALIGATAGRLRDALQADGPLPFVLQEHPGLAEAFESCRQAVSQGGSVLMSPACASFGLFRNYKERGEAFMALVEALPAS